jgi:hypothetical protein
MRNADWHQGITMHRLRVGGGIAGAIVALGFLTIGLVGVPLFRYFLGLAIVAGGGIALGLYFVRRWRQS